MDEISVKDFEQGLARFLTVLSPSDARKAVRAAERRVGNRLRKKVIENLRSTGLKANKSMEKGVRVVLFSKRFGFKVTIKPKQGTEKGYYRNSQGLLKPVLAWAEEGTTTRKTRRGSLNRGSMPAYHFMTSEETEANTVMTDLWPEIEKWVEKAARNNGIL